MIKDGLESANFTGSDSAYGVFLSAVPYSFYPIIILIFVFILILTGKDFGSMKKFELTHSQSKTSQVEEGKCIHAIWAILPIIVLLFVTLFGIYATGNKDSSIVNAIQTGDCYKGLIWGSSSCFVVVFTISLFTKNRISENVNWMFEGFKSLSNKDQTNLKNDLKIGDLYSDSEEEILELSKFINIHHGKLPKQKGRASINWALVMGRNNIFITINCPISIVR